jgi:hypothetical protein
MNNQTQALNILQKLSETCDKLYTSGNSHEIQAINTELSNLIDFKNFELFSSLLCNSTSIYAKFFAANALKTLITDNYLSIPDNAKITIYENLLTIIVKYKNLLKIEK